MHASTAKEADRALATYAKSLRHEFRGKRLVEKLVGLAVAHPPLFDRAAKVLARRSEMADLLIGVAGDFVPAREVLRPQFLFDLFGPALQ